MGRVTKSLSACFLLPYNPKPLLWNNYFLTLSLSHHVWGLCWIPSESLHFHSFPSLAPGPGRLQGWALWGYSGLEPIHTASAPFRASAQGVDRGWKLRGPFCWCCVCLTLLAKATGLVLRGRDTEAAPQ